MLKEVKDSSKPNEIVIMGEFNCLQLVKGHTGIECKGSNFSSLLVSDCLLKHLVLEYANGSS